MTFFTNRGTVPLLITRGIPLFHRSIIVVETSQLLQVKIISGSRVPLSDHYSYHLPRLTRRRYFWSERQSAHLNTMGLRKCHPIKVNPLTVRGYQKHPSKLVNFLPEEHPIQTRDISQEIGNFHPPFNPSSLFFWSKNFLHAKRHGKLSHNLQVSQVQLQVVFHLSICCHHD